jgi:soluble lytic murein transglycosylase-like protein
MIRGILPGRISGSIRRRLQALARPTVGLILVGIGGAAIFLAANGRPEPRAGVASAYTAEVAAPSVALASLGLPRPGAPLTAAKAPRPPARRKMPSGHLSPYDQIIRSESERLGLDWRLIAALIYEESQFDPRARSRSGARGLMQVMPAFAGVPADSLFDPLTNIRAGLVIFHRSYRGFADLDSLDQIQFAVAAYNAGLGRINDARRIAMEIGLDPDRWNGSVADAFLHLGDPRWREQVKHGPYPGRGTVHFVDETLERYERYAERVERTGSPAASEQTVVAVTTNLP